MKYSLPDSADDLLIKDGKLLMRSLNVYEVLRRFGHIIRLTPFRFEDFSAALLAEEQSPLLAEIHIQLLKTLLREDRQQQTWLCPPDLRDSVNIYLHLADHCTWPAALRIYLSAATEENALILQKLSSDESKSYPFDVDLPTKLDVLEQLCDQFLSSNLAREEIVNGNNFITKHDNMCRLCSKANGDLIPCEGCSAIYHLKCSDPPLGDYPDVNNGDKAYMCAICRSNHVLGVSDCIDPNERSGNLKRHEALGVDKLGRRFWFLIRRLFVIDEIEEDVRYYTTIKQFHEIIDNLNENRYEKSLIENLKEQQDEIERQIKITEDLYETLMVGHKKDDGTYSLYLGQDGRHRNYVNQYSSSNLALSKNQNSDKDVYRSLGNKFSMNSLNSFKWSGAIHGQLTTLTVNIRTTILKFEAMLPPTFIHPCWQSQKSSWIKTITHAQGPEDYAIALSKLESCIKPVLFKSTWYETVGFIQLFRSTFLEREESKKTDRQQPRGFERRDWFSQDFELSYRLGTMVKFSSKLKPVKHQVWKQKGEEYRLTGVNGWYWQSKTFRSRLKPKPKLYRIEPRRWSSAMNDHPFVVDMINEAIDATDLIDIATNLSCGDGQRILYPNRPNLSEYKQKRLDKIEGLLAAKTKSQSQQVKIEPNSVQTPNKQDPQPQVVQQSPLAQQNAHTNRQPDQQPQQVQLVRKYVLAKPKLPPCHDFLTKRGKIQSLLVLPDLEVRRLARSGGMKEAKSFSYTAKQNNHIWPYGMTPRPTFRTCWLYRNRIIKTMQDVALQLRIIYACIRWEELQTRPPASGHNTITTDEATVTVELLKKRDKLPYLTHSEYLIRKISTPIEQPAKYRKIGTKKSTPSARSGLRARRQTEEDTEKGPTTEEVWVAEDQLELWELKQFDEKIERQNQLMRERALREEAEKRRKVDEEKRRKAEQERRNRIEEAAKKARLTQINLVNAPTTPQATNKQLGGNSNGSNSTNSVQQPRSQVTTPVLRYFRTEQGQIIRLPASYLQRGTPLILRHVGPGPNQSNTYIIRPQLTTNVVINPVAASGGVPTAPMTVLLRPVTIGTPSSNPPNAVPSTKLAPVIPAPVPAPAQATAPATEPALAPAPNTTSASVSAPVPNTAPVPNSAPAPVPNSAPASVPISAPTPVTVKFQPPTSTTNSSTTQSNELPSTEPAPVIPAPVPAPAQATVPKTEPAPAPVSVPAPTSAPSLAPALVPAPALSPAPEPETIPTPTPAQAQADEQTDSSGAAASGAAAAADASCASASSNQAELSVGTTASAMAHDQHASSTS